ncbi:MAG: toll/interleukin-1 receptor domain-containing protein [Acidimicrobiia bacterium]|nr:toll/interleukin-1 receptor domain-containing protein [Acidimicrobiia bacterium]
MQSKAAPTMGDSDQTYDGFISYSHAADDLLAPRLQSALQRFAKPWWKRRAVRIFRDESSLSANPHLWSSITEALDTSGWFVLLLSPDAARSEWVSQEIAYWVEHRDPKKILPVVTDGSFAWADGDVDGDAVPDVLQGVFSEEPRWVDVRWAKDEDQLDLKDPRFADAIADIASTIRGVPKDDLASEEVRQHRRTVRTAWAAGGLVTVLAIAAVVAGVFAVGQRNDARDNAALAEANAAAEAEARLEADANAAQAAANAQAEARARIEADNQARLAKARALTASSINVLGADPELAALLAVEAIHVAGDREEALFAESLSSLRRATYANRLIARVPYSDTGRVDVAFTPDGSGLLIASELDRSVSLFDVEDLNGEPLWTFRDLTTIDIVRRAVPHPDGSEVAVIVVDRDFIGDPGPDVVLDAVGDDAFGGRIVLLDAATGAVNRVVELEACQTPVSETYWGSNQSGYSPSGAWFHLIVDTSECSELSDPEDTVLFDTSTWMEERRLGDLYGLRYGEISFTADETQALVNFEFDRTELRSFPDFELLDTFEFGFFGVAPPVARIAPDGRHFFLTYATFGENRPGFWSIDGESFLGWGDRYEGQSRDAVFTPDGSVLVMGGESTSLYDPATATLLSSLPTKGVQSATVSPLGSVAATASNGGDVELWRLVGATPIEPPSGNVIGWLNPNWIIDGPDVAFRAFGDAGPVVFIDPTSGAVERELPTWAADFLPDGRFVMAPQEERPVPVELQDDRVGLFEGPLMIRDFTDGSIDVLQDCVEYVGAHNVGPKEPAVCPDGTPLFTESVRVSRDGSRIAGMATGGGEIRIWDVGTLEVVTTFDSGAKGWVRQFGDGWLLVEDDIRNNTTNIRVFDAQKGEVLAEFPATSRTAQINALSHDGSRLFLLDESGRVLEYDTSTWELVRDWQATRSIRGIAVSPDDTQLALSGEDGLIVIWRIDGEEPELVERIPAAADRISDIVWLDGDRLGAVLVPRDGRVLWQVVDLSSEAVVDQALSDLVRGFTETECATHRIDPCPTLEEMRSR